MKNKETNYHKSRLKFLEDAFSKNTKEITELHKEIDLLKKQNEQYKNMYNSICNDKRIMDVFKVLDENNCPELSKQKLSKLWDVLPYYPPDWNIRKWIVKRRDGYICYKCKKDLYYQKEGTGDVHHIRPLSIGGTNEIKNLIFLCHECHKKVHDEMFNFTFSKCDKEVLYEDWTYYRIFQHDWRKQNLIDPSKKFLLSFDSYNDEEPDTDKYYNISYWEDKLNDY